MDNIGISSIWSLPNGHLGCKITVFCQRVTELTADAERLFSFLVSFQELLSLLIVVFDILVNTFEFTLMSRPGGYQCFIFQIANPEFS